MLISGLEISELSFEETAKLLIEGRRGMTVCCCTLNEIMMAEEETKFKAILKRADLLTPDGMPLVWWRRWHGKKVERVYGPDLMKAVMPQMRGKQLFIGNKKNEEYFKRFGVYIVLPFKELFDEDDYIKIIKAIKKDQIKLIWIGLGGEKQVTVADELKKRLPDRVYVTVGAAFDFLSGNKLQAPKWLRNIGGEWLYRMVAEPKRLGGRYLRIIFFLIRKLVRFKLIQSSEQK